MTTSSLEYLLGTYFHQDFLLDHDDEWETLDDFVRSDPHRIDGLPEEIDQLLADHTDEEIATFVRSAGCAFRPGGYTGGYREWLRQIGDRVRARV